MKILFSILHLFLQGWNDNRLIIIICIRIDFFFFSPALCRGQTLCHSGGNSLAGFALASGKHQVQPQKPPQINKFGKTINMLWEKLFNFLSASLADEALRNWTPP